MEMATSSPIDPALATPAASEAPDDWEDRYDEPRGTPQPPSETQAPVIAEPSPTPHDIARTLLTTYQPALPIVFGDGWAKRMLSGTAGADTLAAVLDEMDVELWREWQHADGTERMVLEKKRWLRRLNAILRLILDAVRPFPSPMEHLHHAVYILRYHQDVQMLERLFGATVDPIGELTTTSDLAVCAVLQRVAAKLRKSQRRR